MNSQIDRSLLRSLLSWGTGDRYVIDGELLKASDEQLWGALACLGESEFEQLRKSDLDLERKIRTILEQRGLLVGDQRYQSQQSQITQEKTERVQDRKWTRLGIVLSLLIGLAGLLLAIFRK